MKNIFVVGLDPFNLELLQTIKPLGDYRFIALFDHAEVVRPPEMKYPSLDRLIGRAESFLAQFSGSIDAVIGYWDFPTSALAPLIAKRVGLPGPTLEAVARCEHKYWSRLEQMKAVPDLVPRFQTINPFAAAPLADLELSYPLWIKPVKAHSSFLGFHVADAKALYERLAIIRRRIGLMARPFNEFLAHVELPQSIASIDGYHCIAEEIISAGKQCTLEGYAFDGEVHTLGIVDSIRTGRHRSCFSRYQYPSALPRRVKARMAEAAERVIRHLGYDGAAFNIEFFWDSQRDRIRLLEINSRISKSHSWLFHMVDGATNQKAVVELGLGQRPTLPYRQGEYPLAGKFMLRVYEDGIVERLPKQAAIAQLQAHYPEARMRVLMPKGKGRGTRLAHLPFQDSYSFELAEVFLGGHNQKELLAKFRYATKLLDVRVTPLRPDISKCIAEGRRDIIK